MGRPYHDVFMYLICRGQSNLAVELFVLRISEVQATLAAAGQQRLYLHQRLIYSALTPLKTRPSMFPERSGSEQGV